MVSRACVVIPAKAGIHFDVNMGPGLRRGDKLVLAPEWRMTKDYLITLSSQQEFNNLGNPY